MTEKTFSANIVHDLVKEVTGDEDKAVEAYTEWTNGLASAGRSASGVISLDAINLASVFSEAFSGMNKNNSGLG